MHHILHNWADEQARKILEMLKPAMKPGYSSLLLYEEVVPETRPRMLATNFDMTMMSLFSAPERTESMWRALFESAGFAIIKIWSKPSMIMSIIEVEPTDVGSSDK